MSAPFAPGSVSLRLYPHDDLSSATAIVDELRTQAALAAQHGFDGVMTSEHHGGFHGYLPNPLQAAGWCLEAMPDGLGGAVSAAAPAAATRAGGRGDRVDGGALPRSRRPRRGVGRAARRLRDHARADGRPRGALHRRRSRSSPASSTAARPARLADDAAIAACAEHPIPMLSAAMGFTAARRAARLGAGLLFDSLSTPERCRELVDAYHEAGGHGPVRARPAGVGRRAAPRTTSTTSSTCTASYSPAAAQAHWGEQEMVDATGRRRRRRRAPRRARPLGRATRSTCASTCPASPPTPPGSRSPVWATRSSGRSGRWPIGRLI